MANLSILRFTFLLCAVVVTGQGGPTSATAAPPSDNEVEILKDCFQKIPPACGRQLFQRLVEDSPVSVDCCRKVYHAGEACHEAAVKFVFSWPEFKPEASLALPRIKQAWDYCVAIVANAPAPPPATNF